MTARDELVRIALGEKGKAYAAHRDCSGFTAWAFRQIGISIPEGSVAQFSVGTRVPSLAQVQAGDLLFWDTFGEAPGHVALAINPSQVIHALNKERGIIVSGVNAPMGGPYMGARRLFAAAGDAPSDPPVTPGDPHPEPATTPPAKAPRRDREREQDKGLGRIRRRVMEQVRRRRVRP